MGQQLYKSASIQRPDVPGFDTQMWRESVTDELNSASQQVLDIRDFKPDGVVASANDWTDAVKRALDDAPDNAVIVFPNIEGGYRFSEGGITLGDTNSVRLMGTGYTKIVNACTSELFIVNTGVGTPETKNRVIIEGFEIDRETEDDLTGTAIQIKESGQTILRDLRIFDHDKAIELTATTDFTETTKFDNLELRDNRYAIFFITNKGDTTSFATTHFDHVLISTGTGTAGDRHYGIYVGTDVNMYRAHFAGVTIFPGDFGTCFYMDGSSNFGFGHLDFEETGTKSGTTGWHFDTNSDDIHWLVLSGLRGAIDEPIKDSAVSIQYNGLIVNRLSTSPGGTGFRPMVLINDKLNVNDVREVINSSFDTIYRRERIRSIGTQNRWEVRSHIAHGPDRHLDATSENSLQGMIALHAMGSETTTGDDATPTVMGIGKLGLQSASHTTITNFDDHIIGFNDSGQFLTVRHLDGNNDIQHGSNVSLLGSSDYTARQTGVVHFFQRIAGTWYELSRHS